MFKLLALLLTSAKFGKLALTGGTMLLSVFVYALVYGWWYALGFVFLLLVHEMGHFIAARRRGLDVGLPTFIPFVGAWVQLKDLPHDAETEAYVGLGGPLLGSVAATAFFYLGLDRDSPLLVAIAYAGFMLNLFNLIPVPPFDGGRITAVLGPRIWFFGVPIMVGLFLYMPSPLLLLVAILAAPQLLAAWRHDPAAPEARAYYEVGSAARWRYGLWYLGLAGFLALVGYDAHSMLSPVHP
jgi:Zn-dependent protease